MNIFKYMILISTLVILSFGSGCSTIETLGDYVRENPVFSSVITRQAVV